MAQQASKLQQLDDVTDARKAAVQEQQRLPPQDSDAAQVLALEAILRLREGIAHRTTSLKVAATR